MEISGMDPGLGNSKYILEVMKTALELNALWSIQWVPRECNRVAHNVAKWSVNNVIQGYVDVRVISNSLIVEDPLHHKNRSYTPTPDLLYSQVC